MEKYAIVEFNDGLQMIPFSWITEDKKHAYWPVFTSNERFTKAVQKCIPRMDNWSLYEIKSILTTASTYEKGMKKLKKAEFMSDVNSETEDDEIKKKSRKYRAKTVVSSEESFSEEEKVVQVPSYPKIPPKKNTHNIQVYEKPANRMQLESKGVLKQTKNDNDNLMRKTNLLKNKNVGTLCTSINNKDKNVLEQKNFESNITLTSQSSLKTNAEKHSPNNNNTGYDFIKNNVQDENTLRLETFKTDSVNTSTTHFQRYVIRKLVDMDFKISTIHEQHNIINTKLDTIQNNIQTFIFDDGVKKKDVESDYMDFFPIENLVQLEELEQLLINNKINRKALIMQLARIGGTDIKSLTFNILRRIMSDSVGSMFSYVGGKKKRSFFDLHLRKIIFGAVRIYFPEGTEQTISGPIKSWLRHASERSMKSKKLSKADESLVQDGQTLKQHASE